MYDTSVGPEYQHPLDELMQLEQRVANAPDLASLRPIFYRLEELAKQYSDDFELQLAVNDIKQKVMARGSLLRQQPASEAAPPVMTTSQVPAVPADAGPGDAAPIPPPLPVIDATQLGDPAYEEDPAYPNVEMEETGTRTLTPMAPPRTEAAFPVPRNEMRWKRAVMVGVLCGALVAAGIIFTLVRRTRTRNAAVAPVALAVTTTPAGASIRVNGDPKCTANCSLDLPPGEYQVTAFLDGYVPAAAAVTISPRKPANISLALSPQDQAVRIVTDLPQGKVTVDDQPAGDLQDGQFMLAKIAPGKHSLKISAPNGEASFQVEVAEAQLPAVIQPLQSRNLIGLLVSSMGARARAYSQNPSKLTVNGKMQADVNPAGTDLTDFAPGVVEFGLGEGSASRSMSENFGPAPVLTVFLRTADATPTVGTLIITTNEDDARVFIEGKEYPRKTQRGQLRIQTTGKMAIRVAKDGFEVPPPQIAEVKRGAETRLEFKLQPIPKMASLQIRGATPGADVLLDQKAIGKVGDDGTFTENAIQPGDHLVELFREQFQPRRFQRVFRAGVPVSLSGADVLLTSAVGTLRVVRTPSDAAVTYRRADETTGRELRGPAVDLPPGVYLVTARAPGFTDKTERVTVELGETISAELVLARTVAVAPPPAPKTGGVADFEDPNAWSKQGDLWSHRGGGFVPYKLPASGVFDFTVRLLRGGSLFRGGRIRWVVQWQDAKNYDLFELDRKSLWSKVIIDGKTYDRGKYDHNLSDKEMSYTVQLEVTPARLVHRIKNGDAWIVLDTWQEPGRDFTKGKFGFLVQGNDEIGLADFKLTPR